MLNEKRRKEVNEGKRGGEEEKKGETKEIRRVDSKEDGGKRKLNVKLNAKGQQTATGRGNR